MTNIKPLTRKVLNREKKYREKIRALEAELAGVLDMLMDVVNEACWIEGGKVDSFGHSIYADAIYFLATKGFVEIEQPIVGKRVIARILSPK